MEDKLKLLSTSREVCLHVLLVVCLLCVRERASSRVCVLVNSIYFTFYSAECLLGICFYAAYFYFYPLFKGIGTMYSIEPAVYAFTRHIISTATLHAPRARSLSLFHSSPLIRTDPFCVFRFTFSARYEVHTFTIAFG